MRVPTVLTALLALLAASEVAARPSFVVHHQGRLLDQNDRPVTRAVSLKIELHSLFAAGPGDQVLWQDTFNGVTPDAQGCYDLLLGDTQDGHTALTADLFRNDIWLKVTVDNIAMEPWLQLGLAPTAGYALDADRVGGLDLAGLDARYVRTSGGQAGSVTITGEVTATSFAGGGAGLTGLNAAALATGTIAENRLPSTLAWTDRDNLFDGAIGATAFAGNGAAITNLDASQLSTGTLPSARLPAALAWTDRDATFSGLVAATRLTGNGAGITALDASNLASGTVAWDRLPGAVARTDAAVTFAGSVTGASFTGASFTGSGAGLSAGSIPLASLAKGACAAGQVIRRKADDSGWECFTLTAPAGPAAFAFTNVTSATPNTLVESAPVTVTGFSGPLAAVCTGCEVRRGTGEYLTVLPGVTAGDVLTLRMRSSAAGNTTVNSVVTVGATMSAPWSVTTTANIPDCYSKPTRTTTYSINELIATMPTNTWICVKSGSSAALAFKLIKSPAGLAAVDADLQSYFDTSLMRWTTDGGANWSTPTIRGYWFDESGIDDYMFLAANEINGACRGGTSCTGVTWRYDGACTTYYGHLNYSGTGYGCNGQSGSTYTANW